MKKGCQTEILPQFGLLHDGDATLALGRVGRLRLVLLRNLLWTRLAREVDGLTLNFSTLLKTQFVAFVDYFRLPS